MKRMFTGAPRCTESPTLKILCPVSMCGLWFLLLIGGLSACACVGEPEILVPAGTVWRYLDDGSRPGATWTDLAYDDSGWKSGPAELGYGDGDEATTVRSGPEGEVKFQTTYFRHAFQVKPPGQYPGLLLKLLRDDGAVVYLNGKEAYRANMPEGTIVPETPAADSVSSGAESYYYEAHLDPALLRAGDNVVAVEIHQCKLPSSDVSFDLELIGTAKAAVRQVVKGPYLIYPGEPDKMMVLWQLDGPGTALLEWGAGEQCKSGRRETEPQTNDWLHRHTVAGLEPNTLYHYRLTVDDTIKTGSFRSAPGPDADRIGFMAMGDTRSNPNLVDKVAAGINQAWARDERLQTFVLHVGDWVGHGDKESHWTNQFFNPAYPNTMKMLAHLPVQGCMGNHEGTGVLFVKYWPYPFTANRYWSFDYGPVHVAVVDQYAYFREGSSQFTWLEEDLRNTTRPWKIVMFHEPGWSAGGHEDNLLVQQKIQPMCEAHGVDLILAGHNHYYARCLVNGVTHVTTGGGGAPLRTPDPSRPHVQSSAKTLQFCQIEIDGDRLTLSSITPDGDVIDEVILDR